MKLLALLALIGAATAQVQISSNNNDATIERRQTVNIFEMSRTMAAQMATQQAQIDQLLTLVNSDASPLALGIRAIATEMTGRTQGIVEQQAVMSTQVAAMTENVEAQLAAAAASTTAALTAAAADVQAVSAEITRSSEASAAALDTRLATGLASINTNLAAVNVSLQAGLVSKADSKQYVWIGGARDWGNSGGFRQFKLDRSDYDSLSPKGRKDGDYIRVLVTGMYKAHFWTIQSGGGHGHGRFWFNNQPLTEHYHNSKEYGWWTDITMHIDWKLTANGRFETRLSCGGHRWHAGNSNTGNNYNRFSFRWLGAAREGKCSGCIT